MAYFSFCGAGAGGAGGCDGAGDCGDGGTDGGASILLDLTRVVVALVAVLEADVLLLEKLGIMVVVVEVLLDWSVVEYSGGCGGGSSGGNSRLEFWGDCWGGLDGVGRRYVDVSGVVFVIVVMLLIVLLLVVVSLDVIIA